MVLNYTDAKMCLCVCVCLAMFFDDVCLKFIQYEKIQPGYLNNN